MVGITSHIMLRSEGERRDLRHWWDVQDHGRKRLLCWLSGGDSPLIGCRKVQEGVLGGEVWQWREGVKEGWGWGCRGKRGEVKVGRATSDPPGVTEMTHKPEQKKKKKKKRQT